MTKPFRHFSFRTKASAALFAVAFAGFTAMGWITGLDIGYAVGLGGLLLGSRFDGVPEAAGAAPAQRTSDYRDFAFTVLALSGVVWIALKLGGGGNVVVR